MRFVRRVTLTFLPSSFIMYSTVVRIPFSSTESSILEGSVPRSIMQSNYQSMQCIPSSSTSSAQDVLFSLKMIISRTICVKVNLLCGSSHFGSVNVVPLFLCRSAKRRGFQTTCATTMESESGHTLNLLYKIWFS